MLFATILIEILCDFPQSLQANAEGKGELG
jgi:hypothetical protein